MGKYLLKSSTSPRLVRRLYPLGYTPYSTPDARLLCEASMMLLIGPLSSVFVIVGREIVRRRKCELSSEF